MTHEMKLNKTPFELIVNGQKIIEVRLFDEKRQKIQLGDKIRFTKLPELQESIMVQVNGLLIYPDFRSLFLDFPGELFGGRGWSVDELVNNMHEYYSVEGESKYGVIGIKLGNV